MKEVNCGDFIFIEDFLDFVSKSKVIVKMEEKSKGTVTWRSHRKETTSGEPL